MNSVKGKAIMDVLKSVGLIALAATARFAFYMFFTTAFIKFGAELLVSVSLDWNNALRFALGVFCLIGAIHSLSSLFMVSCHTSEGDKK